MGRELGTLRGSGGGDAACAPLERAAKEVERLAVCAQGMVDAPIGHGAADLHLQPLDAPKVQRVQVEHVPELAYEAAKDCGIARLRDLRDCEPRR